MLSTGISNLIVDFFTNPTKALSGLLKLVSRGLEGKLGIAWSTVQTFFTVLDAILILVFIGVFFASLKYRPKLRPSHTPVRRIFTIRDAIVMERWQSITAKAKGGTPDANKVAIIDADKLVDDILKQLGLQGEHMADRLEKLSSDEVRSLDRIWRAHRLRNNLVHTPGFQLTLSEAKKALEDYEAFLKEVKVLQ